MTTGLDRSAMTMVSRKVRAYFAPSSAGALMPLSDAGFASSSAPPAGWSDVGWIENLKRTAATRIEALCGGSRGATVAQVSSGLDARVEFDFMEWGKLQMALSACGPHMNQLAVAGGATVPSVPLLPGSSSTELVVTTPAAFSPGDMVAVDLDYTGQTGLVGSGIAGASVASPSGLQNDVDYVRRITFNVGRIASVTATSLVLQQPLMGGAPVTTARVQKVTGYMDREGGTFFPQWAAIFVLDGEAGGRLCFQYPRLQVAAPTSETIGEVAPPLETQALHASFRALPQCDASDGEQVLCYRTYTPAPVAPAY